MYTELEFKLIARIRKLEKTKITQIPIRYKKLTRKQLNNLLIVLESDKSFPFKRNYVFNLNLTSHSKINIWEYYMCGIHNISKTEFDKWKDPLENFKVKDILPLEEL